MNKFEQVGEGNPCMVRSSCGQGMGRVGGGGSKVNHKLRM